MIRSLSGTVHKPYPVQRRGRDPQQVHRGWIDPALDIFIFEPPGGRAETLPVHENHVNYNKINQSNKLSQLPIPREDQVLDYWGSGRVFDLVSLFQQIKTNKDTVPLTAFCIPTGRYEWLLMPRDSGASPGRFVRVIDEMIKDLNRWFLTSTRSTRLIPIRWRISRRLVSCSTACERVTSRFSPRRLD